MRPSVPAVLVPLIALTLTGCLSVDPDTEAPGAGPTEAGNASPLVEEAAEEVREEPVPDGDGPVSYTNIRAHETDQYLVC
ncbi:hypothetical protein MTQ13_09255, partial [Streptomyces sp. XM4011]|uniref:hypothetical protein n=1 Tax=Streptomyces sp. XM4011 TaxID=2929780 RepID=UPI001FF9991F